MNFGSFYDDLALPQAPVQQVPPVLANKQLEDAQYQKFCSAAQLIMQLVATAAMVGILVVNLRNMKKKG